MQYDMAYKRAQRLQNRSWAEIQVEAHKLAALGLPVRVWPGVVQMATGDTEISIRLESTIIWRDGHWDHATIDDVAQALRDLLAQRQKQATTLAGVAGAMKQDKEAQS